MSFDKTHFAALSEIYKIIQLASRRASVAISLLNQRWPGCHSAAGTGMPETALASAPRTSTPASRPTGLAFLLPMASGLGSTLRKNGA